MRKWFEAQPEHVKIPILIGLMFCGFLLLVLLDASQRSTPASKPPPTVVPVNRSASEAATSYERSTVPVQRYEPPSSRNRDRQAEVEGMTQAARDAGYDDATAAKLGSDAAALCNGNPECLK